MRGSSQLRPDVEVRRGNQTAFVEVDSKQANADQHRSEHKQTKEPGAYVVFRQKKGPNSSFSVSVESQGNLPSGVAAVLNSLKDKTWTAASLAGAIAKTKPSRVKPARAQRRPVARRGGRQREFEYESAVL